MTIARRKLSDTQIEISYCINLVVKAPFAESDTGYAPRETVYDSFNKAKGRMIAAGRLGTGKTFIVTKHADERWDMAILRFLSTQAPDFFAQRLGCYYYEMKTLQHPLFAESA